MPASSAPPPPETAPQVAVLSPAHVPATLTTASTGTLTSTPTPPSIISPFMKPVPPQGPMSTPAPWQGESQEV
jgi:hypothetical protein